MITNRRILWVDDDLNNIMNWKHHFETPSLKIDFAIDSRTGLQKIQNKKYDKVLVDLEMPGMDGIDFIKEVEENYPDLKITIVSAHLDQPPWKRRMKTLKRKYPTIETPFPIVISDRFKTIRSKIYEGINMSTPNLNDIDVNQMSLDEYLLLDNEDLKDCKKYLSNKNRKLAESALKRLNAAWVLIVGGKVFKYSENPDDFPDQEELIKIGEKRNLIPYLFFRPPIIEEIIWNTTKAKKDFFPTLKIKIKGNKKTEIYSGDFDTGAEITFLNFDDLNNKGIVKEELFDFVQSAYHLGQEYKYFVKRILIGLICEDKTIAFKMQTCIFVKNWEDGPFQNINQNRVALIGRDIFKMNKVVIVLDNNRKMTKTFSSVKNNLI